MSYGSDDQARHVLSTAHTWAVVGLGTDTRRTAFSIAAWLLRQGKRIIPVHPAGGEVLGETIYPRLADIPVKVDVVDIFRRSDQAGVHVDEAIALGIPAVWLQLGVVDFDAAQRAEAAGLTVLMDRCPHIEGPQLLGWPP
jgi:predicted CoA-binding protein